MNVKIYIVIYIKKLGWNNYFEENFAGYFNKDISTKRIVSQQKNKRGCMYYGSRT
ncbi:hypothetical protein UT300019_34050 [Clostridium sp. CTA-19]